MPRALYESLVGATSDAIISVDSQGRVLLWNPAAERMFGYGFHEVLGLKVSDLIVSKEHAGSLEEALGSLAENTRMEIDAKARGSDVVPVEISISKTMVNREAITTLIVRGIRDRKLAEKALQDSERRYRTLFEEMRQSMEAVALERSLLNAVLEQMPAGVIIAEAESGKPIMGNKKAETMWTEGFREDQVEEWPLTSSIRHGEVVLEKEITFRRKDGTRPIMSANSAPIYDDRNRIIAGVITFHDITSRKEMEEELRRSRHELELRVRERTAELKRKNRELQDFAFIASHDLHEPLRKIQTFGDLLVGKFECFPDELARDYVGRMQKAAARMELLLDSLLKYSRLNSKVPSLSLIDLSDAVRDAMSNLEIRIKETGGSVEIGPLPTLEADSSQMSQVFQNLIGNALKFHRKSEPPRIRIYSRGSGDSALGACEICVEDNGIGFDEKYLDRIFMPFQRLHGRNEYSGVGMGLAICKKIVERHGGAITARSTEGEGSTFTFTLPDKQAVQGRPSVGDADVHGPDAAGIFEIAEMGGLLQEVVIPADQEQPRADRPRTVTRR
jgi:PAS domain S-box-containing protein